MNKDTIYIEPEDDITDVLNKLKKANQKVVALVPPKKTGVLRSAVNMKLIAKTAKSAGKVAVIVSPDLSIMKMAAIARIPVAKTLQSRPEIPTPEMVEGAMAKEQVIEEDLSDKEEKVEKEDEKGKKTDKQEDSSEKKADLALDDKEKAKGKDKKKKNIPAIEKYRKWIIIGAVALVVIVGVLIWAFAIAPSAKITVKIRASANDFSENVSFGLKNTDEDAKNGKFLLEENTYEVPMQVNFTATGKKDAGTKATGTLTIYAYFKEAGTISVPSGTSFAFNGNQYVSTGGASLSWDGNDDACEAGSSISSGCVKSSSVAISAAQNGDKYNISGSRSEKEWTAGVSGIIAYNSNPISGGTTKEVTVVSQSDIEKAKSELADSDEKNGKEELMKKIKDGKIAIESSYSRVAGDAVSSPAVGEEVGEGTKPTLKATTVYKIFTIDKPKVEEFIREKTHLTEDQEIYSIKDPYFERFTGANDKYSARLKTSVYSGPKITEEDILNQVKGKKVGEVQSRLKSINGISDVEIKTSFFWVGSIPNDSNKVQIEKIVEDQNQNN